MDANELFWTLADELMEDPDVEEGTMMGTRCLRVNGAFLAMVYHKTGSLIVKLPEERVRELVASGDAEPFAPNGRVFREWASVPELDEGSWRMLLAEGRAFAAG